MTFDQIIVLSDFRITHSRNFVALGGVSAANRTVVRRVRTWASRFARARGTHPLVEPRVRVQIRSKHRGAALPKHAVQRAEVASPLGTWRVPTTDSTCLVSHRMPKPRSCLYANWSQAPRLPASNADSLSTAVNFVIRVIGNREGPEIEGGVATGQAPDATAVESQRVRRD